ncbi:baseplate J/gp47 family protein [Clostridiaceae bacterium OttesenSCG-928-D20]|nr:baseplate J/gp47 family protein [Clostridiaceae bacterium OttesenSCG-928-D20]
MKTMEEIYERLKKEYSEITGIVMSDSGDMAIRLRAFAAELFSLWLQADWLERQTFPQTATGESLDKHARLRSLERTGATRAEGQIQFFTDTAAETKITIPKGTVCRSSDGVSFETVNTVSIAKGTIKITADAVCRESGEKGNVIAGAIVFMTEPPIGVLGCVNPQGFSGGQNAEDDESLRKRILTTYKLLPNGANKAYYETKALSAPGIKKAIVIPRARGKGTIDVIVSSETGVPDALKIAEVLEILNSEREICVDISVLAPERVEINLDITLIIAAGYSFTEVSSAVRQTLESYFTGERLGEKIYLAKLGSLIFSVPGVENYRFQAPTADIEITQNQLPVLLSPVIREGA